MSDQLALWNGLVELDLPKLGRLIDAARCEPPPVLGRPLYPGSRSHWAIGENIFAHIVGGEDPLVSPVLSVGLVVRAGVLPPVAVIQPRQLDAVEVLGLATPFSAAGLLNHLRDRGVQGLVLSTEANRYKLLYGPLGFLFVPKEGVTHEPSKSLLATVNYYYQVPRPEGFDPTLRRLQAEQGP